MGVFDEDVAELHGADVDGVEQGVDDCLVAPGAAAAAVVSSPGQLFGDGPASVPSHGGQLCGGRFFLDECDLYPDVRPALADLRARGLKVGVAGIGQLADDRR